MKRAWLPLLLFILLAGLLIPLHLSQIPNADDDAYIHMRIASHLADMGQPYYNPGERVMGSSSSLWTLSLASLYKIFPDRLAVIAVVNALSTAAAAVIYGLIFRRLAGQKVHWAVSIAAGLAVAFLLLNSSTGLMETSLAMLTAGCAVLLFLQHRSAAWLLFGLLPFFRLELAFFSLLFFLYACWVRKDSWVPMLLAGLVGVLPCLLYDLAFFSTLLPFPVAAKSQVYWQSGIDAFGRMMMSIFPWFASKPLLMLGSCLAAVLAPLPGLRRIFHPWNTEEEAEQIIYLFLLSGAGLSAAYLAARTFVFAWYIPLYVLPLAFGLLCLGARRTNLLALAVCAIMILGPCQSAFTTLKYAFFQQPAYPFSGLSARVRKYLQVGQILYQRYPTATLLTSEIGGLGWSFKGHIIDGAGLISPQALRYHPMKVPEQRADGTLGAIPAALIRETRPEIIVSYDVFLEEFLKSDVRAEYTRIQEPRFLEEDQIRSKGALLWETGDLNIFIRKDIAEQTPYPLTAP